MFESKSSEFATPSKKDVPREDVSFIDSASAILSSNGGRAISLKSSYLENMSVRTPKSHVSKANSSLNASSRTSSTGSALLPQDWLKYRIGKKHESARKEQDDEPAPAVPFPFLAAFIERGTGKRFSKRVKFDPS